MADLTYLNELLDTDLVTPISMKLNGKQDPDQIRALRDNGMELLSLARRIEDIAKNRVKVAIDNCPGHVYEGSHVCKICSYDSE